MNACEHGVTGRHLTPGATAPCERLEPNAEDYWLGPWPTDTRTDWTSADDILRLMQARELGAWTSSLEAVEDLMVETREAGGLHGLAPEFHTIRAALIKRGSEAI